MDIQVCRRFFLLVRGITEYAVNTNKKIWNENLFLMPDSDMRIQCE